MRLDERMRYLIAVGASVSANCRPCLELNVARARELGADEHEIGEAIAIGRLVRKGAAAKMDAAAASLGGGAAVAVVPSEKGCGCGS